MSDLNRSPTFRFPPVGRCIYCRTTEGPLSDEHIVPLSLGGNMILPEASCKACADATHAYEGKTSGSTLRNIRLRYGFPTRHKKKRETHIEIGTVDTHGRRGERKIPVTEYPVGGFLLHCGRAGIFLGAPPHLDTFAHLPMGYPTDELNEFKRRYDWDGVVTFRWLPVEYAQTIIKICYCYAVAHLGLEAFSPMCIPQILSRDKNVSYIFGQIGKNELVKGVSNIWEITLLLMGWQRQLLLVAHCSILPGMGTPIYEVALGKFESMEQATLLSQRIADGHLVIAPAPEAPSPP